MVGVDTANVEVPEPFRHLTDKIFIFYYLKESVIENLTQKSCSVVDPK